MVFIDLTLQLAERNHKSSHIRTIYIHWLISSPPTLPNTANNGTKQITKEKTFQLYQCCANNFLEEIFCRQFNLPKWEPPSRKIIVHPLAEKWYISTFTAKIPNLKTRKIILFQDFKSCFRIYNLGSIARKLSGQDCNSWNKNYNLLFKIYNLAGWLLFCSFGFEDFKS